MSSAFAERGTVPVSCSCRHSNVDRIFALWQALNPDSYVEPWKNPFATFTLEGNSIADINTRTRSPPKQPLTSHH